MSVTVKNIFTRAVDACNLKLSKPEGPQLLSVFTPLFLPASRAADTTRNVPTFTILCNLPISIAGHTVVLLLCEPMKTYICLRCPQGHLA